MAARRTKWSLTEAAFGSLLSVLDSDWERAGEKYEQIRKGLIYFFECRGCRFAEDCSDETLNRVSRKIEKGEQIADPYTYVYGVARLLALEVFKQAQKESHALRDFPAPAYNQNADAEEKRIECLQHCLESLSSSSREFITQYYLGEKQTKIENRKRLAEQMSLPLNALRLRARRVREKLEICVNRCMK